MLAGQSPSLAVLPQPRRPSNLHDLPQTLQLRILEQLPGNDAAALTAVCYSLRAAVYAMRGPHLTSTWPSPAAAASHA